MKTDDELNQMHLRDLDLEVEGVLDYLERVRAVRRVRLQINTRAVMLQFGLEELPWS